MSCIGISRKIGKFSKGPKITMFRKWVFENEIELKVPQYFHHRLRRQNFLAFSVLAAVRRDFLSSGGGT